MLIVIIVFVLSVCYYAYFRSTRRHFYELSRKLPSVGELPVLGHTHWFIGGPEIILNPEDIQTVLEKCLQKDASYKFLRTWLGNGLFVAPVDLWKVHRRLLLPMFHNRVVESFTEVFGKHSEVLVQTLQENVDGPEFDVFKYVTRCSLDIVFETAMGERMDLQHKPENGYVSARNTVMSIINMRLFKAWLQLDAIFNLTPYASVQKKNIEETHQFTDQVIRKKKLLKENSSVSPEGIEEDGRRDMLDMLLSRDSPFTDEQLREHIDSITIAGNDTTSLVVAYALVLLGSHKEEQDKVYKELKQIFGDSKRIPSKEDLNKMEYLERVIKETMRLYTVVPVIARETQSELKLSTCTLPAGVGCAIVPFVLHRSKRLWGPDADDFRPDRFLPENSVDRHPCAFIPFSFGSRNCIGRYFGMLAMKSLLAGILRTYEVSAKPCGALKIEILLIPVAGHMVNLRKR
ncbi:cytochrome P450 4C1-like isoform X2 [Leguminivora glycinivorella]|uniref:cytochrome P450 4C1-like isoform X2 n=1 Tax=Leguminivora glycinivorella TaxID=1035111 RepID=UPI00200E6C14|nr:cytochrome P450 4C1-like isoform X2 [Leguminivora glycinivorella]